MKSIIAIFTVIFTAAFARDEKDFFSGMQTGIFVVSEQQLEDYSCPMPTLGPMVKQGEAMIPMMKEMTKNMGSGAKMIEAMTDMVHQISVIYSIFMVEYDGGEYCKGLIFAHNTAAILKKLFGKFYDDMFKANANGEVNPAVK
jgi:hypothetical protein